MRADASRISQAGHQVPGGIFDPVARCRMAKQSSAYHRRSAGCFAARAVDRSARGVCQSNSACTCKLRGTGPIASVRGTVDARRYVPSLSGYVGSFCRREERDDAGASESIMQAVRSSPWWQTDTIALGDEDGVQRAACCNHARCFLQRRRRLFVAAQRLDRAREAESLAARGRSNPRRIAAGRP